MSPGGLWIRVFVGLLWAVVPPIVLVTIASLASASILRETSPVVLSVAVVGAAAIWCAALALVFNRVLADDIRHLVTMARRGTSEDSIEAGSAQDELARALDRRNRQVAVLASQSSELQIHLQPSAVASSLVAAARAVLEDDTWRLAVLHADDQRALPAGIYDADPHGSSVKPIGDLERWASVTDNDRPARHVDGPWGAFVAADVPAGEWIRAILYAPWQGRTPPAPAELDLIKVVSQHVGTALDHALLYATVRAQADELTRLATVQADFLRGVTHDLQTPLTSISALATELRASTDLPDPMRADLETIAHQAERLRRMVSQLLVASRLEAGAFTAEQEVFAVTPAIQRTWSALRADRPFSLTVDGPPHLAVGDPDRLEQVLWAVFDNAVKYSPPGSPITVVVSPAGGMLVLSVTDMGAGMDEMTRTQAFNQFFRAPDARRAAPDGSGVGLYAARGLMLAMGGDVLLTSELGQGTTVEISVPAEPAESSDAVPLAHGVER